MPAAAAAIVALSAAAIAQPVTTGPATTQSTEPASTPANTGQTWPDTPFQYNVVDQDLRDVFHEYGRQLGVIVQLSDEVHGRVRNLSSDSSARAFLDRLASTHDLVWYFDGSILHVATTAEVVMRSLSAEGVSFDALRAELAERSSTDPRLSLRLGPDQNLITVTGPLSYIGFVEQTAETLRAPPAKQIGPTKVNIWRGGKLSG